MAAKRDWFTVDPDGLSKVLAREGKEFVVLELIQNAWDEDGVTTVNVTLEKLPQRGKARLIVKDDAPAGFLNLDETSVLYAPSKKQDDPSKRGRWNVGEKKVLALCDEATIVSTTGGRRFDASGRHNLRRTTAAGTEFSAIVNMTEAEVQATLAAVATIIPPGNIRTVVNGSVIAAREPVTTFNTSLRTEIANPEGYLTRTTRKTEVQVFAVRPGEKAMIYEMGLPVVATGDLYHVNVLQKVPLNSDRNNVPPAYLADVRTATLNATVHLLTPDHAAESWVNTALENPNITPSAVKKVIEARFGEGAVTADPNDQQANKTAASKGVVVVWGASLTKRQWENVRGADALPSAGIVYPTPTQPLSPDGKPPIPRDQWSPNMQAVARYMEETAHLLLGKHVEVEIHIAGTSRFNAWYTDGVLSLNMARLGNRFFDSPTQRNIDRLLIHELGHDASADHLSEKYHDALCDLGAQFRNVRAQVNDYKQDFGPELSM